MRQIIPKTAYLHKLVVLAVFVSAPLLGSCQVNDDDTGPSESQCVIEALQTIASNYPTESVEIDVEFAPPQLRSNVLQMLARSELQPFALFLLRGDDAITIGGDFRTIEHAIDAAQTSDVALFEPCLSETSANDLQSQTANEHSCEIRITRLKLRGPANAALAFKVKADSIATTSRIPSNNELIDFAKAQFRQADDASTELLDCTQGKHQPR